MEPESAPPFRDPIGLLSRSPELAALARSSTSLRKAIERGRPFDAYRALFWGKVFGRFKGEAKATAEQLLAHRRIFFKPLTSAPAMMTFNGVGTSLYGSADRDLDDGTYVATLFVVVLFLPIFPIASYLVRSGGGRSWTFMAKVPMGLVTYLWQRAIGLGVLGVVAFGASAAFEGYGHATLHVVNGLDHPVTAQISGTPAVTVQPSSEASIRTPTGKHTLVVRDGDRELESSTVDIPRGRGSVVWNILGAAPLYVEEVVYSPSGADAPKGTGQIFCGDSLVLQDSVDYAFVEPPASIQMEKGATSTTRKHLGIAKGGVDTCAGYLVQHGQPEKASHIYLTVAKAEHLPAVKLGQTLEAMIALASHEDAEAFAKDLLARDDSVDAHRIYQDWLLSTGQRDRVLAEYDARAKAHPDDADAEYLALRLRDDADPRVTVDAAVVRHPRHGYLRHMQIYAHRMTLDFQTIATAADVLREVDIRLWSRDVAEHATALVALDRGREALDMLVTASQSSALDPADAKIVQLYAFRVAQKLGDSGPGLPKDADPPEGYQLFQRVMCGLDIETAEVNVLKNDDMKGALRIARDARMLPDRALDDVRGASDRTLAQLPTTVVALLFGEATLRGDAAVATKLTTQLGPKKMADAMTAYVRAGTVSEDLRALPFEMIAALDFVRSRSNTAGDKDRKESLKRARKEDALHGPVSVAIEGWPP